MTRPNAALLEVHHSQITEQNHRPHFLVGMVGLDRFQARLRMRTLALDRECLGMTVDSGGQPGSCERGHPEISLGRGSAGS